MLVEFSLAPEGRRTRLRVTQTGLAAMPWSEAERRAYVEAHLAGWDVHLARLRDHLSPPYSAEVSVRVAALPKQVFPYLTDPARHGLWMGSEATLEPVPGGTYRVRMPDGVEAAGTFLRVEPPSGLAFTWGFAGPEVAEHVRHEAARGSPMPAGSTGSR